MAARLCGILLALLLAPCTGAQEHGAAAAPAAALLDVKLRAEGELSAPLELLPAALRQDVASIVPLFSLRSPELQRLGAQQLRGWFRIGLRPGTDRAAFLAALRGLDVVLAVEVAPAPAPPPAVPAPHSGPE